MENRKVPNISQGEHARTSIKLTEPDLTVLYDLIKGDRYAQAAVWSALEAFRMDDYRGCQDHIQSVFVRVGDSLRETIESTAEERAKKIVEKIAADQGKAYRRVATPDLMARTKVKAEQQVEKAHRIMDAFESVLARLTSSLAAQAKATVKASSDKKESKDAVALGSAESSSVADDQPPPCLMTELSVVSSDAIKAFKESNSADEARQALRNYFNLRDVDDQTVIQPGALFHLQGGQRGNLVRITSIEQGDVQLENPQSGDRYTTVVPVAYFLTSGSKGQTHLLVPKQETSSVEAERTHERERDADDQADSALRLH